MNVVILDTGCANLNSVKSAIGRHGYEPVVSRDPEVVLRADKLFLPGVGTAQAAMDQLRDGIGLRAYGNKNPITEYQIEGYDMFDEMVHFIREDTVRRMYQARINIPQQRKEVAEPKETNLEQAKAAGGPSGPKRVQKQVGRNDPCPCGSGKKYKNCCGRDNG